MSKVYLYVDGESHFIRSSECWKGCHGDRAELEEATQKVPKPHGPCGFPNQMAIGFMRPAKFFFDPQCLRHFLSGGNRTALWQHEYWHDRAIYFTSFAGDDKGLALARTMIRQFGFEPVVVKELKEHAKRRENKLRNNGTIEKAKGVDIALSVRMLEDAYHNNFEKCFLFTSDADYLPVIEAVRRRGKVVFVAGFGQWIPEDAPLRYVPDHFFDLGGDFMRDEFKRQPLT